MNLLAATTPAQSAPAYNPAYQNQAYQNTTQQPDRPVQQPNWKAKVLGYGYFLFNIAVVVFVIVMIYRFVKAFEKIAGSLEKGINVRTSNKTEVIASEAKQSQTLEIKSLPRSPDKSGVNVMTRDNEARS